METLTRAELSDKIGRICADVSRSDVESLVDEFFKTISSSLETGGVVRLSGFGNFLLLDKNQRPGRNPKTGDIIPVSARRVVTFRPGNKLKETVDRSTRAKSKANRVTLEKSVQEEIA
tara:strand:- start:770 stop:1123 length:354 start_codon:yes stop_codon:yes gene_type:complete